MRLPTVRFVLVSAACATLLAACATTPRNPISFFVTSKSGPDGGNFGGLAGADQHCQTLAAAVGAGHRTWRAYLSTNAANGGTVVNARDRIGTGPWQNAKGVLVATSVADLHSANSNVNKQTAITETGEAVTGRGDTPNQHDILTGSTLEGTAAEATCNNWTLGVGGSGMVGHHDRTGINDTVAQKSFNAAHPSRGCSLEQLKASGGAGKLYCFAAN